MPGKSLIFKESFWNFLSEYEGLKVACPLEKFLERLGISPQEFGPIRSFLEVLGLEIHTNLEGDLLPLARAKRIHFDLSFSEWLAMQAHFLDTTQQPQASNKIVKQKIEETLETCGELNLAQALYELQCKNEFIANNYSQHQGLLMTLEESASDKNICEVVLGDQKVLDLFIHRIVFLDGELCVVAEDCTDRCLVYLEMNGIRGIKKIVDHDYSQNFSAVEVNDFIFAIRSISGNEERLVIKIKNQNKVDLTPPYHFLGNPYITSNMEGDLIWAASVETSPELFHWLSSMEGDIEILDPPHVKEDFQAYCHGQKKLKKAS